MSIEVERVTRRFSRTPAVDDVSLSLAQGELVALLGPSGSGKTTLLRLIAGLELPESGRISLDGRDVTGLGARERRVGFVFQHYALFRHMTVADNVAFGLRSRPRRERPSEGEIARRVARLLDMVQLGWSAKRYPAQLSGGERQRVALARALAIEPSVLLLDEPFGALDAKVRRELRGWIRRLHHEVEVTSVFVTHDQEEALEIADRVVVLNRGRIEQIGTPAEICTSPANAFVYDFIGQSSEVAWEDRGSGRRLVFGAAEGLPRQRVRPHELRLLPAGDPAAEALLTVVGVLSSTGLAVRIALAEEARGEPLLEAELTRWEWQALGLGLGDRVGVALALAGARRPG